ncbi:MAG: cyclic-di-AMP receptor [Anaerolineae bacterium]|nr:cyclic-di-AMP receptor [Anaerolineae bacterium]
MKLIMAIVSSDDSREVLERLTKAGYRATVISTTGGFLREGNTTIFLGVEDARVAPAIEIVRTVCRRRTQWVSPLPTLEGPGLEMAEPIEVSIGGAVMFVMNVEQFVQA